MPENAVYITTNGTTIFGERKIIKIGAETKANPNPVAPISIPARSITRDPPIIMVKSSISILLD
jgi:hypothetical protein